MLYKKNKKWNCNRQPCGRIPKINEFQYRNKNAIVDQKRFNDKVSRLVHKIFVQLRLRSFKMEKIDVTTLYGVETSTEVASENWLKTNHFICVLADTDEDLIIFEEFQGKNSTPEHSINDPRNKMVNTTKWLHF